jgi:1-acyl-sn-glycerol-3-phosphate acyltransferase
VQSGVEPSAGQPVPLRGSRIARSVLRLLGWRLVFDALPARQGVLLMYPHTSNWDFPYAMLAKAGIGLPVRFLCKESLFRVPLFGRWLRAIGGVPIRRDGRGGAVGGMVELLRQARGDDATMWLGLSPEGTRGRTEGWRTGFYEVALQAGVPLALAFFDYRARRIGIDSFVRLSGDRAFDMATIAERLASANGKRQSDAAPIRLLG